MEVHSQIATKYRIGEGWGLSRKARDEKDSGKLRNGEVSWADHTEPWCDGSTWNASESQALRDDYCVVHVEGVAEKVRKVVGGQITEGWLSSQRECMLFFLDNEKLLGEFLKQKSDKIRVMF